MIDQYEIRLARAVDATVIAHMSRETIEHGLGWRWTAERILKCMGDKATNVAVVGDVGQVAGFAIAEYQEDAMHIMLLAVDPAVRRHGIGAALVAWHEATALVAGIGKVFLEARTRNEGARAFYQSLGYSEIRIDRGFYRGQEDGVRLSKDLWAAFSPPG